MRYILIALAISSLISSCEKHRELKYAILSAPPNIYYNETLQLNMSHGTNSEYTWRVSDEFVGLISAQGLFTASHIGDAVITAEKDGKAVASLTIKVLPYETFFEEPYVDFYATQELIKSKEKRVLVTEDKYSLKYLDPSPILKGPILYAFSQGYPYMGGIMVQFHPTPVNADRVKTFYAERYRVFEQHDTSINFADRRKKYMVIFTNDPLVGLLVTYNYYSYVD